MLGAVVQSRFALSAPHPAAPTCRAPPQVLNVSVLAVESEQPDPRVEAWEGRSLAVFLANGDDTKNSTLAADSAIDDVHAALTSLNFCPLHNGNVLNMTASASAALPVGRRARIHSVH